MTVNARDPGTAYNVREAVKVMRKTRNRLDDLLDAMQASLDAQAVLLQSIAAPLLVLAEQQPEILTAMARLAEALTQPQVQENAIRPPGGYNRRYETVVAETPNGSAKPDWREATATARASVDRVEHIEARLPEAVMADLAAEAQDLGLYDDDALPPTEASGDEMDAIWSRRLGMHAMKLWQSDWGPRPGEAGCLVPEHLLPRSRRR